MAQFVYRRPPYPYYDMEGIESWLEDLITDGLWLDKDGYVFGTMQFRPGTPCKLKYRLEPIEKQSFLYLGQPNPPSEKSLTLYEEFGWEYLGTFYDFYIYRSMDESAVELNTDPTLQAQALRHVRRRSGIMLAIMTAIVLIGLVLLVNSAPLLNIIQYGWIRTAVLLALLIAALIYSLIPYLHTVSLQKKLERGEILTRSKNWRKGRFLRRLFISLPFIFHFTIVFFNTQANNVIYQNSVDPAAYSAHLPFVTLEEIAPERTLESYRQPQFSVWDSPLASTNLHWDQSGTLRHPQEDQWIADLEVDYHEASSEWIAKELVREYAHRQTQYSRQLDMPEFSKVSGFYNSEDYGFDDLIVYDTLYDTVLIIRSGNHVIRASCGIHTWGTKQPLFSLWLEEMAALYA